MAISNRLLILTNLCLLAFIVVAAKPQTLVIPIRRSGTLLLADFQGRIPLTTITAVVDVTEESLWLNCETGYTSKTYTEPTCGSAQCKTANTRYCHTCGPSARPFCHANTCGMYVENPVTHQTTVGELAQDVFAAQSTAGPTVKVPDFLFTCSPSALVDSGLQKAQGVFGLAKGPVAAQNQLPSKLGIRPVLAMCIPSGSATGPLFFGDGPYNFLPKTDASKLLGFTPLIVSPFNEYYFQVNSVKINTKRVPLNASLLNMDESGVGGTMISTTEPYTILRTSLYKSITSFYRAQLSGLKPVKPVGQFGLCYNAKSFGSTRLGPGSPSIDLELAGGTTWSIFGANSLVEARPGVLCLAFLDGGNNYRAAVVVGTYQMQDTLVQVDLDRARVGFSGLLLGYQTNCGNFNFTGSPAVAP